MPIKSTSNRRSPILIRRKPQNIVVGGPQDTGCGWELGCCFLEMLVGCLGPILLVVFLIGIAFAHGR
jgi:hypothetical protein